MKQKIVKLEISKLIAIIIVIVAIAFAAGFFVQSSYFQGLAGSKSGITEKMIGQDEVRIQKQALKKEVSQLKSLLNNPNLEKLNLEKAVMRFKSRLIEAKVSPELIDEISKLILTIPEQDAPTKVKKIKALEEFAKSLTERTIENSVQKLDADLRAL